MAQDQTVDSLIADLLDLRRGHGVLADDAPRRVSPSIRSLCGIGAGDSEAAVRQKLVDQLAELTLELPDYVRPVVGAALALPPHTQARFLHQRMKWAAEQIDRDHPRTATRRLEPGLRLLAELMLVRAPIKVTPGLEWHTVELDAMLRMDLDVPVLSESRTIVALVDSLDEVTAQLTLPPYPGTSEFQNVRATMVFGGEIVEQVASTRTHAAFLVRFPQPMMSEETHKYGVEFAGPPRDAFNPMYVMEPLRRCDRFCVRVRFAGDAAPSAIWRISGLPPRRVDEHTPTDEPVEVDSVGEASAEFTQLAPGLSYGLQWLR